MFASGVVVQPKQPMILLICVLTSITKQRHFWYQRGAKKQRLRRRLAVIYYVSAARKLHSSKCSNVAPGSVYKRSQGCNGCMCTQMRELKKWA